MAIERQTILRNQTENSSPSIDSSRQEESIKASLVLLVVFVSTKKLTIISTFNLKQFKTIPKHQFLWVSRYSIIQ